MIQREKLILLRKEKGLTQMQVAEDINVSRQAVSGWETGAVVPSIENLKSLSVLYQSCSYGKVFVGLKLEI